MPAPCGPKRWARSKPRFDGGPGCSASISSTRSRRRGDRPGGRRGLARRTPGTPPPADRCPAAQNIVITGSTRPLNGCVAGEPNPCSTRCSTTWLTPAICRVSSRRPVANMSTACNGPCTSPAAAKASVRRRPRSRMPASPHPRRDEMGVSPDYGRFAPPWRPVGPQRDRQPAGVGLVLAPGGDISPSVTAERCTASSTVSVATS